MMIVQHELKLSILRVIRKRKERGAGFTDVMNFLSALVQKHSGNPYIIRFLFQVFLREVRSEIEWGGKR
ncbi:hypothetical protein [Paenibacillus alvei]|uniref:hypothetical protein n=1 Tax=Paenibacillus alvei TaxID=44250 RepID=UPI002280982B|nr:hypothetical protein [Paenibacillus alvei]